MPLNLGRRRVYREIEILHGLASMTVEEAAQQYARTYIDPMDNLEPQTVRMTKRADAATFFRLGVQWANLKANGTPMPWHPTWER